MRRAVGFLEREIEGRSLRLSNLDKVMWPQTGFTKGEVIDFYESIAPIVLPHIRKRPLTLARYPDGVEEHGWYQTNCPNQPQWLPTQPVPSPTGRAEGGRNFCVVNEPAALVWVANLASIELHPLLSTTDDLSLPTGLVFDLDPGFPAGIIDCCGVALEIRPHLEDLGLRSFVKVSGGNGLHVHVPLNTPGISFGETKRFCRNVAARIAAGKPELVTDRMAKDLRVERVFVDWSQNDPNKSLIAPYSLRAAPVPLVAAPLRWEEVEQARGSRDPSGLLFGPEAIKKRISNFGDLFAEVLTKKQDLPAFELK